ncbi:ankyrin repeat domain-containing protein 42-like isoform X2 [Xenia sp. Carnegie-2017]|uniref:ankyrin repeat domain-containing protein 42-like isoform X2 n=1 Tax=Xenia sp. Carnegie-2017 TaxID=2897299 RepID=UPI001F0344E5|nr:ankyrin repeat domain-containing protein 42-like isoform X2 [Xenia sp. Carnegie-2017]
MAWCIIFRKISRWLDTSSYCCHTWSRCLHSGSTPSHLAATHGNSYTLQSILRHGIDIDCVNKHGWTSIHAASFHGRLGCLQLLFRWGARLDETDTQGNTPVHLAAVEGHLPCLKFLICSASSIDQSINSRNNQGERPLDLCVQMHKQDCIDYLQAVEYDLLHPEKEENLAFPAHAAAYNGDLSNLKMLIETGVVSINERNDQGSTPTHKAAGNGHLEVLQWLIEQGADLSIVNAAGETPKDVARRFGRLACINILGGDTGHEDLIDEVNKDEEPRENRTSSEAKGRAKRKMEELQRLLNTAKMNFQQLGGELEEDKIEQEEKKESARVIRELEAQLEYERVRREELEEDSDKLRSKIHSLTMELEESRNVSLSKVRSLELTDKPQRKKKTKRRPHTALTRDLRGFE